MLNINVKPEFPQKKKLSDQFKMVIELAEESEKVFWIIDFDSIKKETIETKKGNRTPLQQFKEQYPQAPKNAIIVINNPCLEFWFLLHYKKTSKYFTTYTKLEKELKKYLSDYHKTEKYFKNARQDIYQRLKPLLQQAIKRAKAIGEFNFDNTQQGISEMFNIYDEFGITEKDKK